MKRHRDQLWDASETNENELPLSKQRVGGGDRLSQNLQIFSKAQDFNPEYYHVFVAGAEP